MRVPSLKALMHLGEEVMALLSRRHRVRTGLLILFSVLTAAVETLGIASIAPFLAVLAAPDMLESNHYLNVAYRYVGESREQFLFLLGLLAFGGLFAGTACRALNSWGQIRFARSLEYALACRLMTGYLQRPYVFFLSRNSSDLTKMVLSEASQVVAGFLAPAMRIVSNIVIASFLLALLGLLSPTFAVGAAAGVATIYAVIFFTIRRWLLRLGQMRFKANQQRFEAVSEVFGGIKEIKLLGNENAYFKRFSTAFSRVARAQANSSLAGSLPVYALELIVVGGGLMVALYYLGAAGELTRTLPLIALFLLCARRMLPALQNIFKAVTQIRYSQPAVTRVLSDFRQNDSDDNEARAQAKPPLPFEHVLMLDNIGFTYPKAAREAISGINIQIPMGARVGFVGVTGSGKTTTVDLILGLLAATSGRLTVDGTPIGTDNVRAWQANLGYVPQHIYLADDTVSANIALGLPAKRIDQEAVEQAARLANIHDFVLEELPRGYMTMVGERGVRLSGGQRQRIGIARALYRVPKVLLFDEATSALDNRTEKAVIQGLQSLGRDRTMIFIAHRLTTVRDCDLIYLFVAGKIKACGTYDELTTTSSEFQSIAAHGT
jgi:ABC-type bacteriocin/lantibiotic exporter with double-glycine peptidase domain